MTVCTNPCPAFDAGVVSRSCRGRCRFWALWLGRRSASRPVGDVAELGDVDVDQRAGVVVFVAADRLAGARGSMCLSRLIRQRTSTACTVEAGAKAESRSGRSQPVPPAQPHDLSLS